ncbi:ADL036Cp [Eremothecium gossypii ATCC 10895]|uniref:chitin deacetylase n=1 Tax=Eremothecium gossypii (strain ATCC 10895 / CBS 109.51 / FGSC 9923 / NRRL Y-1056) TaxID=284811 RepID=Q75AF4_EREGS|nr:ADL036Cp [Eremothecium gossypii ATCC 10895]AAS51884.1 ADL036Cp [Eremothecium gossypii ATCC 10895]AEY96183.1 FADL036Cp [Eremothecium gossypii FDAG1]
MKSSLLKKALVLACASGRFAAAMPSQNEYEVDAEMTPFPAWLTELTGLSQWPDADPPYIPIESIDLSKVPDYKPYREGECHLNPPESCSFDCYKCLAIDDVHTCPRLSQTFDDGPSEATLELLGHLNHKTTFFNLGYNIVRNPAVYRQVMAAGHLIGTHTWSHPFLPSLTNEQVVAQLQWSIWAMNATGNHLPRWFRPPYGGIDNRIRAIARQFGLTTVLWDRDTFDWMLQSSEFSRTEQQILDDVTEWMRTGTGLILEHDGHERTARMGIQVNDMIGPNQMTVAECAGGVDYLQSLPWFSRNSHLSSEEAQ